MGLLHTWENPVPSFIKMAEDGSNYAILECLERTSVLRMFNFIRFSNQFAWLA